MPKVSDAAKARVAALRTVQAPASPPIRPPMLESWPERPLPLPAQTTEERVAAMDWDGIKSVLAIFDPNSEIKLAVVRRLERDAERIERENDDGTYSRILGKLERIAKEKDVERNGAYVIALARAAFNELEQKDIPTEDRPQVLFLTLNGVAYDIVSKKLAVDRIFDLNDVEAIARLEREYTGPTIDEELAAYVRGKIDEIERETEAVVLDESPDGGSWADEISVVPATGTADVTLPGQVPETNVANELDIAERTGAPNAMQYARDVLVGSSYGLAIREKALNVLAGKNDVVSIFYALQQIDYDNTDDGPTNPENVEIARKTRETAKTMIEKTEEKNAGDLFTIIIANTSDLQLQGAAVDRIMAFDRAELRTRLHRAGEQAFDTKLGGYIATKLGQREDVLDATKLLQERVSRIIYSIVTGQDDIGKGMTAIGKMLAEEIRSNDPKKIEDALCILAASDGTTGLLQDQKLEVSDSAKRQEIRNGIIAITDSVLRASRELPGSFYNHKVIDFAQRYFVFAVSKAYPDSYGPEKVKHYLGCIDVLDSAIVARNFAYFISKSPPIRTYIQDELTRLGRTDVLNLMNTAAGVSRDANSVPPSGTTSRAGAETSTSDDTASIRAERTAREFVSNAISSLQTREARVAKLVEIALGGDIEYAKAAATFAFRYVFADGEKFISEVERQNPSLAQRLADSTEIIGRYHNNYEAIVRTIERYTNTAKAHALLRYFGKTETSTVRDRYKISDRVYQELMKGRWHMRRLIKAANTVRTLESREKELTARKMYDAIKSTVKLCKSKKLETRDKDRIVTALRIIAKDDTIIAIVRNKANNALAEIEKNKTTNPKKNAIEFIKKVIDSNSFSLIVASGIGLGGIYLAVQNLAPKITASGFGKGIVVTAGVVAAAWGIKKARSSKRFKESAGRFGTYVLKEIRDIGHFPYIAGLATGVSGGIATYSGVDGFSYPKTIGAAIAVTVTVAGAIVAKNAIQRAWESDGVKHIRKVARHPATVTSVTAFGVATGATVYTATHTLTHQNSLTVAVFSLAAVVLAELGALNAIIRVNKKIESEKP